MRIQIDDCSLEEILNACGRVASNGARIRSHYDLGYRDESPHVKLRAEDEGGKGYDVGVVALQAGSFPKYRVELLDGRENEAVSLFVQHLIANSR